MRVLFGLAQIPRSLALDDPRLPALDLGPEMLRLNTQALPVSEWGADVASHAGRRAAVLAWLQAQAGDYNNVLRRRVAAYFDAVDAEIAAHEAEISATLARFDGLYAVQDRFWSAPRPLVRAWWQEEGAGAWQRAELVFWDGVLLTPEAPLASGFWREAELPRSPFRHAFPHIPSDAG